MSQPSTEPELRKMGEPTYRLEFHTAGYDIRVYQPYLVAEVIVPGPRSRRVTRDSACLPHTSSAPTAAPTNSI